MKYLIYIISFTILSCNKGVRTNQSIEKFEEKFKNDLNCKKSDWHPTLKGINQEIKLGHKEFDSQTKLYLYSRNPNNKYTELKKAINQSSSIYKIEYRTETNNQPPLEIQNFNNIEELVLTGFNSEDVMDFVKKFKSLTSLMISGNYTSKFHFKNGLNVTLEVLNLNSNYIRSLSQTLSNFTKLNDLNLAHNSIGSINLINLPPNIERLTLYNNYIENIEGEFTHMVQLKSLHLGSNCLSKIDNNLMALKHLEYLELSKNNLLEIPKEIFEISTLKKVYLSDNQLNNLPNEIINLKELEYLFLDNNAIVELPKELFELKRIKKVSLRNNNLKSLPKGLKIVGFEGEIDLRGNQIDTNQINRILSLNNKLKILI
jgi:Leucine-rich repeat (LRR) protein